MRRTKLLQALRWSLARRGVAGTVRAAMGAARRRLRGGSPQAAVSPWDRQWGVETSGFIVGSALGAGAANAQQITGFASTAPSSFREVLALWRTAAFRNSADTEAEFARVAFLDVGCGKGRVVMLASEWPFREAVGVELDPDLAETAQTNLQRWRERALLRCPVSVLQGDALDTPWPDGDLLVYLYNPFSAAMLARLLDTLAERRANGDRLWLIYHNEAEEAADVLTADTRLECLWRGIAPISSEDRAVELVVGHHDRTGIYRLR